MYALSSRRAPEAPPTAPSRWGGVEETVGNGQGTAANRCFLTCTSALEGNRAELQDVGALQVWHPQFRRLTPAHWYGEAHSLLWVNDTPPDLMLKT